MHYLSYVYEHGSQRCNTILFHLLDERNPMIPNAVEPKILKMRIGSVDTHSSESAGSFKYVRVVKTRRNSFHSHKEVELLLVLDGGGMRKIGDSVQPFQAGELYLVGSDLVHTWYSDFENLQPIRAMVIQFLPEPLMKSLSAFPEFKGLSSLLLRAEKGLAVQGRSRKEIAQQMERIGSFAPTSPQRLSLFLGILAELCESADLMALTSNNVLSLRKGGMNEKLNLICLFIQANLTSPQTQASVAERVGMSPASFSRFFKHYMGKRYTDYINEARIDLACRALTETDREVANIASDFGFPTISHFNKTFKNLKRTTPSAYRRHNQEIN
jgi:AraC-like DNA-binding protein/mannose-6-phosphate isomerase-like protein (cupin superfamily)